MTRKGLGKGLEKGQRVKIVNIFERNDILHCGSCCIYLKEDKNKTLCACDCELERIPLYVQYVRGIRSIVVAKSYAFECLSCNAINKRTKKSYKR